MHNGPDQLRDWMRRRGVNQHEAAELISITDVYLSQILNGKRQPGLPNAIKIERLTGIPVESWLLSSVSNADDREPVASSKPSKARR